MNMNMNMTININTKTKPNRGGFTLVEMLVVVAIIGILAAILIPTLYGVVIRGQQTVIGIELGDLDKAIVVYKDDKGDFPPDFSDANVVTRHLRKAFPRHTETPATIQALTNASPAIRPSEALVFWLSQLKNDPRQPLSGQGDDDSCFTFDEKRLRKTRIITLGTRSLQLYEYIPENGNDAAYVYFDCRTYSSASYLDSSNNVLLYPYKTRQTPSSNIEWANKTTYQIICAGLDGDYGRYRSSPPPPPIPYKVFPIGTNYDVEGDMDNQANFSEGKIFEDHME